MWSPEGILHAQSGHLTLGNGGESMRDMCADMAWDVVKWTEKPVSLDCNRWHQRSRSYMAPDNPVAEAQDAGPVWV